MNLKLEPVPDDNEYQDELRPGTVLLHGQYVIQSNLVRGGFGITYLARDSLDRTVVIKECFPSAICCRVDDKVCARSRQQQDQFASVLRHFIREARRLSKLSHPDIVGVHQVFEERDTAYMALDYVEGSDLLTILEEDRNRLDAALIASLLNQTLDAVSYIHDQGILHRDISPDNILLDATNSPTLIDFGAAREHATRENRALSALLTVKDGYSPQEFYLSDEPQRPSSDLYSLGATFYHIITGEAPPQSQQRLAAVASHGDDPYVPLVSRVVGFDRGFLAAIDKSLEIFPDDRFHSASEWKTAIKHSLRRQAERVSESRDAKILRAISELIESSDVPQAPPAADPVERNKAPQSAPGRSIRAAVLASAASEDASNDQRQFVDIFGNPVEDVEAWLESQESERARRALHKHNESDGTMTGGTTRPRSRFLRGFLNRKADQHAETYEN